MAREHLPIPDPKYVSLTTYDAQGSEHQLPTDHDAAAAGGAPNVLIVLIDDVGFGASSAFGGPCNTPVAERLAANGLKLNRFHTTALCSPTRQAMLTGRNHHSVGTGAITEMATSAPGNSSVRPKEKAPIAETLKLNGYSTAQFGKCHEVPVWQVSAGPFHQWPTGSGFEYFYGFVGGEANQYYRVFTRAPRRSSCPSHPRTATRSPRIWRTAPSPGCASRRPTPDKPFSCTFAQVPPLMLSHEVPESVVGQVQGQVRRRLGYVA